MPVHHISSDKDLVVVNKYLGAMMKISCEERVQNTSYLRHNCVNTNNMKQQYAQVCVLLHEIVEVSASI